MNFTINEKQTISEIQQRFLKAYPYLKIEFYKGLHASGEGSAKNHIINGGRCLHASAKKEFVGVHGVS